MRVISFDAGGVLLFPDWERISSVLARHGLDVPAATLSAADPHAKFALDHADTMGSTNNAGHGLGYFHNLLEAAGVPASASTEAILADIRAAHAARNLWSVAPAGLPDVLSGLRSRGFRLIVVSNSDGRLQDLLELTGLGAWFDFAIDSREVGVEKPDPAIFSLALARLGAPPSRAWHVGDLYHVDVRGARAAGLTPVLLDPAWLYADADCVRVRTLGELAAIVE
jgi:HAD superfamily hydrolase (TIGR01509 family)